MASVRATRALPRPRLAGLARLLCAAVVWIALDVAISTRLYEPLPTIPFSLPFALAVSATFEAGLLAARWPILALAFVQLFFVPDGGATPSDLTVALPFAVAIVALPLLAAGVGVSRVTPRRTSLVVGALLLAAPLPLTAWAAARTIWPHDADPSSPLAVDPATGTFGRISLGERTADALHALPPTVTDASFPVGVTFTAGDATRVDAVGVSLLTEHGHVVTLFITDPRAEAVAGVGVGDSLALARERLRGLRCERSSEDVPTCAGRAAHPTAVQRVSAR